MSTPENAHQEIVIVRRHGDHEEAHHGGVWKIAFADFMTAMMAFFLVMWLISASDKNREAIARYFNPLKLVDTTTRPKGLHDPKKDDASVEQSSNSNEPDAKPSKNEKPAKSEKPAKDDKASKDEKSSKEEKPSKDDKPPAHSEAKLFQDPYGVLSEIARGPEDSLKKDGQRTAEGAKGGDSFRDPFAPPPPSAVDADADLETAAPDRGAESSASPHVAPVPKVPPADAGDTKEAPPPAPAKTSKGVGKAATGENAPAAVELRAQLAKAVGASATGPALEVRKTGEGLLISLTDKSDFAMFASGSAEPDRKLVLLMEKVSRILQGRPGKIVVRGHTDARPFRSGAYDNWRLSADRAQMAHYMLVRGGLDEKRIERIEGYADHLLKTPANPDGAQNRRIELLIREDKA